MAQVDLPLIDIAVRSPTVQATVFFQSAMQDAQDANSLLSEVFLKLVGLIHRVLWLGHHSVVHVGHFANVGEFCEVAEVSALLGDGYGKVRADFGLGR